jgi:hypothetical protein
LALDLTRLTLCAVCRPPIHLAATRKKATVLAQSLSL